MNICRYHKCISKVIQSAIFVPNYLQKNKNKNNNNKKKLEQIYKILHKHDSTNKIPNKS